MTDQQRTPTTCGPGRAGRPRAGGRLRRWRSCAGRTRPSARRFCVTSSMADAVVAHLAAQVAPGVDVVFLDTGYHFAGDHRHPRRGRGRARRQRHHAHARADASPSRTPSTGRTCSRPRPRPVLRAAQGRAAGAGPEPLRRLGDRPAPRRVPDPGEHPGRRPGTPSAGRSRSPRSPAGPGRRRRLRRRARRADQPAADGRLRLGRLRALHPPGAAGRGRPRRPLGRPGQDRVRDAPDDATQTAARIARRHDRARRSQRRRSHRVAHRAAERRQDHHRLRAGRPAARPRATGSRCWTATRSASSSPRASASAARTGDTNVQRIGFVAELLARNGVKVLVPVIAPYADSREAVRKRHDASGAPFVEVHVATPVEVCSRSAM